MKVLVTGASNQIGAWLVPGLLAAGHSVLAISRRPRPTWLAAAPGLDWRIENLAAADGESLPGVVSLVHAAPLALVPGLIPRLPDLRRAQVFSSTSVSTKAESDDPGERRLARELAQGESRALSACAAAEVPCTILRPTLIYGAGLDRSLTRLARWLRRCPVAALPAAARGLRQPVHAADLAALVMAHLDDAAGAGGCYALPGGETLAYRQMLERVAASQGRRLRLLRLPAWSGRLVLSVLRRMRGWSDLNAAMLARLDADLVFDAEPARHELGFKPRPFQPDADTWKPVKTPGSESANRG